MLSLKVNLDAIEAMLYFWEATKDKEKVHERFLNDLASLPAMTACYDDEFTAESTRKVLSALTNREPFAGANRKEGRFYTNNLWMLEDLGLTREMVQPIKVLNLDQLAQKLSGEVQVDGEYTVYFAPLHLEEAYAVKDGLVINFFRLQPDFAGGVTISHKPLLEYIEERLLQQVEI